MVRFDNAVVEKMCEEKLNEKDNALKLVGTDYTGKNAEVFAIIPNKEWLKHLREQREKLLTSIKHIDTAIEITQFAIFCEAKFVEEN